MIEMVLFFIFCEFSFKTSQNKESQRRADIRGLTTGCIFSLQLDEPITRRVGRGGAVSGRLIYDAAASRSILKIISTVKPGSYVAFLPCRMQFKQKIMKQIISLSIVSITFDTAEMGRMNRSNTEMTISDIYYKELIMTSSIIHTKNQQT